MEILVNHLLICRISQPGKGRQYATQNYFRKIDTVPRKLTKKKPMHEKRHPKPSQNSEFKTQTTYMLVVNYKRKDSFLQIYRQYFEGSCI